MMVGQGRPRWRCKEGALNLGQRFRLRLSDFRVFELWRAKHLSNLSIGEPCLK